MNPTAGRETPGPRTMSRNLVITVALGGLLGLSLGLILWAFSMVRPEPSNGTTGLQRNAPGRTSSSARGGAGTLGPETVPRSGDDIGTAGSNGSPKAAATRYAWSTRFRLHDMDGALDLIQANLQGEERTGQERELIDELIPHSWTEIPEPLSSADLEEVFKKAGGTSSLEKRWKLAHKMALALEDSVEKVGYLTRMEYLAGAFREASMRPRGSRLSPVGEPLRETDEKGEPLAKTKDKSGFVPSMIDFGKEGEVLRSESTSVLRKLDNHPWRETAGQWLDAGWHLARTGLLTLAGALLSAVGAVLLKFYSELIGDKIVETVPVKLLAGADSKRAVDINQDQALESQI